MSLWIKFKNKFKEIINEIDEFKILFDTYKTIEYNLLLFSYKGFPLDLFIDELLKTKFNIKNLYKNELIWNKTIIYYENQYFLEIDLNNPNISNDYSFITDMILFIIKNRPLISNKHLIIIKNIDKLEEYAYAFRIIIEKYYNNVYFICTTNKISKIESPIKSRFSLIRMRLFTINEIQMIFNKYLECEYKTTDNRNIIFNIFLAQVNINEPHLITKEFCEYNYPLIKNFMNSKYDLNDIRQLSYKLSQYNLSIQDIILDLIKIYKEMNYNNEKIKEIIDIGADIDYILTISNKGREPIFIENLLCQILI
jgi:hypothetical protein